VNVRKRSTGQTALHLAAYNNECATLLALVTGEADPQVSYLNFRLCCLNSEPGVRMLLTYGADRDARDDAAQTPLECALQVKAEAVVRALTE